MLNAREIREVRFSKAMGGYKQEEVDVLLDKIEADYEQYERIVAELKAKLDSQSSELEDYKNSQGNIQNVLVSAQKFADQIVEEAKAKSAEILASAKQNIEKITAQEQELTSAFDKKAGERKQALESDVQKIITTAEQKKTAIEKATQDAVDRQQLLFDKMKIEIAAFKADITNKYKEHLELLSKLPDTVPVDPSEIAAAVSLSFEKAPTAESFTEQEKVEQAPTQEVEEKPEEEVKVKPEPAAPRASGFVVSADKFGFEDDTAEE